jgi:hypothetical protein
MGRSVSEDRFWSKVDTSGECWEWTAAISGGYGRFKYDGAVTYAHRASWRMHFGDIPSELQVCHHCDNRRCVRPAHLFLGTVMDNAHDAMRKGRRRVSNDPATVRRRAYYRAYFKRRRQAA